MLSLLRDDEIAEHAALTTEIVKLADSILFLPNASFGAYGGNAFCLPFIRFREVDMILSARPGIRQYNIPPMIVLNAEENVTGDKHERPNIELRLNAARNQVAAVILYNSLHESCVVFDEERDFEPEPEPSEYVTLDVLKDVYNTMLAIAQSCEFEYAYDHCSLLEIEL